MQGKLIIIEAGDGSGKATQTGRLYERLAAEGRKVRKVEYPNYQSASSALIKMYLSGEFGSDPNAVNPFAASAFYAVDRYASFKKEWETFYNEGGLVIADRYTTSNMIHQAVKISDPAERDAYLDWLWDLEFVKFGLPAPDCVFFLDMPPAYSRQLLQARPCKSEEVMQDIHERDQEYLTSCYHNAKAVANKYKWKIIPCTEGDVIRDIDAIHEDIIRVVRSIIG
ncbi:MAG: hypothetical protein H6Q65_1381 [Firmicutes bacterium]|nr:hypothetical protein [Bacillota bacterium]